MLSHMTPDGRARAVALAAAEAVACQPTPVVSYESAGAVLVVGPESQALNAANSLGGEMGCSVVVTDRAERSEPTGVWPEGTDVIYAPVARIRGHLGRFEVVLEGADGPIGLGEIAAAGREYVDLALDLTTPGFISSAIPPIGYYAPAGDSAELERALAEIPALVGAFEKPKFFDYNPDICAHARSGIKACTRCLDACPADAISSIGERVEVDPNLCQGAGSCATACPTGAITYAYPRLGDTLERLRACLGAYREAGGSTPAILFHDVETGREILAQLASRLPEHVIPIPLQEVGSAGMDAWLAAIAYGAAQVVLLSPPDAASSVVAELEAQLSVAGDILEGMGYPRGALRLLGSGADEKLVAELAAEGPLFALRPAGFAGLNEKRTVIRLAVDHLFREAPEPRPLVSLPTGAPFGDVSLDETRCTLCMACVSQCPGGALMAGDEQPELKFVEENCVQCALCARSCPENAIAPSPRYLYDREARRRVRVLKSEEPFCCIRCGEPFATRGVIGKMTSRLSGHAMFQGEALSRIQMCAECRVKALFEGEQADGGGRVQRGGL